MRRLRTLAPVVVVVVVAVAALLAGRTHRVAVAGVPCARAATAAYTGSVQQAVASKRDLWGGELLRAPGGPTYDAARSYLPPLTRALQWRGRTLTPTGSYYLPFSFPFTPYGSTVFALHVADGSEIITRNVAGPSLQIYVGNGRERYGSCAARLPAARLAEGWLPILQTSYTDAGGVKYHQESFVGRSYGVYGARSVISFVKLTVDARHAPYGATVRLVPWKLLAHSAPDRLALKGQTRLIVSDGAQFVDGVVRYRVPRGQLQTIYALWLNAPSDAQYVHANASTYDTARATVVSFWEKRLAAGATFTVPEPAVEDAMQGVLTQLISFGWRYSIGNPYEELSFAESLDAAETSAEYGYASVARQVIDFALARMKARPWRFTAFRGGHILATAALYYRLTHDHSFLHDESPALVSLVQRIQDRQIRSGPLKGRLIPEALSTDLEDHAVDSVSGQIEAVEGLLAMSRVWSSAGWSFQAKRARELAGSIDLALQPALAHAAKRMRDGSLFVPDQLSVKQRPYAQITTSRDGSYWNLVMPYAFASGYWPAHSTQARGILRYLLGHGSRLLGIPRTYARTIYGEEPGAGIAPVYALSESRFFADNDQPDQLVLTLYGLLAGGMTQGTYVSGEAVSLLPLHGAYARSMFMPPNSGSNASYLGTLREMLVHERRTATGAPAGLDLAFSTPRAWLADGDEIDVRSAPTSFGKVTYSIARRGDTIEAHLVVPGNSNARLRLRVPAGEHLTHVVVDSTVVAADRSGTIPLGDRHGAISVRATVG